MNKAKFLSSKGVSLIGVGLLIVGLAVLLVLSPDIVLGQGKDKGGKPEKPGKPQPPALYRVYFSTTPPDMGIDTVTYPGCNGYSYVLAEWDAAHNNLHANGTLVDPVDNQTIPLSMRLLTDVGWTRNYPTEDSGTFDGCYGETDYYNGALFITFTKIKRKPIVRFTWYFDYYTDTYVREHFALFSEDIPFQAWTGRDISGDVQGWFDLQYYLNDPDNSPSYKSLTDDVGRTFNFWISIEKISQ